MKNVLFVLFAFLSCLQSTAQDKKGKAIGISFLLNDFQTAQEIRTRGLSTVMRTGSFLKNSRMSPGLAFNYLQGISNHFDFKGSLAGFWTNYPVPNRSSAITNKPLVLEATATVNAKLLTDRFLVTPFFNVGVGASQVQGYYAAFIPAGVGVQVNFFDQVFMFLGSSYRIPVTENGAYYFQHSVGFAGNIGRPRPVAQPEVQIPVVEPPKDRDSDGIIDENDECPDVAGTAALRGCPDRDGDGIADKNDNCPDIAGTAKYQGCPVPDTDKDGINDEEDRCINVPGIARYNGCPIPDGDGDGVNDEEDKCPTIAGPRENQGCPVIEQAIIQRVNIAAKNIFFATGSAKLLAKSFPKLDDVVKIMQDDKLLRLDIEGHTDITGTAEKNQVLSENRANAVRDYLVGKGIEADRLTAQGFGPDKPIADNKTAAGRAKNRRVEMKLRNY
jgi:OmpA-OmpF porin, OOP family